MFAALEKNGNILLLALKAHDLSGICGVDEEPIMLQESLCAFTPQSPVYPNSLQFDIEGTRLFAVDFQGKVIVVDFGNVPDLQTLAPSSGETSRQFRLSSFKGVMRMGSKTKS